jgi:membrane-bound lytic murein transglycosylase F
MKIIRIFFIFFFLYSCQFQDKKQVPEKAESPGNTEISDPIERDLPQIREEGTLRAITVYSATSYFLYRGQPMGFEYELLERLAKHLGLELKIVVARDMDDVLNMLNRGEGDIVAYGLAITEPRKKKVSFTEYHTISHQVLVQKKPDNWRQMKLHEIKRAMIDDAIELIGDTVWVRKNSSYHERLINLIQEIGDTIYIDTLPGNMDTEEIIHMVSEGKIKYTVADYNMAAVSSNYFQNLDIHVPISLSQRLAWAVRKNSPELLSAVNEWIHRIKKTNDYYVIYNKYFESKHSFKTRSKSEFFSKKTGKISQYDDLIKKYAASLDWDWRLLSSLIFQESRFDPKTKSWAGAHGLMQLMPATARQMGIRNTANPEENIKGGTKYLKLMTKNWTEIPDSVQRIKFVMASYNCGYNHVVDAQNLAQKNGKDGNVWDKNTEKFILKLSYRKYFNDEVVKYGYVRGTEPYNYVREIFRRYELYKDIIPE